MTKTLFGWKKGSTDALQVEESTTAAPIASLRGFHGEPIEADTAIAIFVCPFASAGSKLGR